MILPYIVNVALILATCLVFYKLLLRRETFYKVNRYMLITCLAISFALPLLQVPQQFSLRKSESKQEAVSSQQLAIDNKSNGTPSEQKATGNQQPVTGNQPVTTHNHQQLVTSPTRPFRNQQPLLHNRPLMQPEWILRDFLFLNS